MSTRGVASIGGFVVVLALHGAVHGQPADDVDLDVPAAPAPVPPDAPQPRTPEETPSATVVAPEPPITPEPAPSTPAPVAASAPVASVVTTAQRSLLDGIEVSGYVQAQGQLDQQSQDQLMQGGTELNRDGFVVRRARVGLAKWWDNAALTLELDANTVRGATVGLRRAEAIVFWPTKEKSREPLAALAIGLTDIPFGHELVQSSRERLFTERSTASLAFFPGEPDIGARAWGAYDHFRYSVAALAGEPINERAGINRPDPNQAKDLVARVGVDVAPADTVTIAGGVSLLLGRGFHRGSDATKDSIEWRDLNENGAIELGELTSVPGMAALPSESFDRWAFGADIEVGIRWAPGWLRVAAEVTVASNLDRGLFVADPILTGGDIRHLGAYVAAVQDIGYVAFAGVRFDYYDPNLDAFDSRSGALVPFDETITTLSPLVGARITQRVRASVQYDWIGDHMSRDPRGVPADLANDRLTVRLQVSL